MKLCSECYNSRMSKNDELKKEMLQSMGDYVLANGLNAASLRPLAKAAGTSDRMLIYHFENKQKLLSELLTFLAKDLQTKLNDALPRRRARSAKKLLLEIISLLRREPFSQYMQLWLEIVSSASRGSEIHGAVGKDIIDGFRHWLTERLPNNGERHDDTLAMIFLAVEGSLLLDAIGQTELSNKAIKNIFG